MARVSEVWFKPAAMLVVVFAVGLALPAAADRYAVEQVKGNVYRFSYEHYHSVFMVTDEGIVVTDPINEEAAEWLKAELAESFEPPVLYMIYSHNHVDHTLGGHVFDDDGVIVVAHDYAAQDLEWTRAPTAMPELTFADAVTIKVGDSSVELRYHGPNNGRGSISMRFMPANVMYVVDWVVLGRMMYKDLPGYDIHGVIASTRELLQGQPFDRFVGGHGDMGTREDVEGYLAYVETLYSSVLDGMLAGKNLKTLQKDIRLPAHAHLSMYEEWLPLNIAGVYRTLIDQSYLDRRPDVGD